MAISKKSRYIAQKLTKYFPNKYPTYTSALPHAKAVYADFQDAGTKVTVKNIKAKLQKHRAPVKKGTPRLPVELTEEINYFDLGDYPAYIAATPKEIYFTSKIFPSTVSQPLQGGKQYSYEELFSDFVNYMNSVQANSQAADDRYVPESDMVLISCTQPKKKGKIWISEIVSISTVDYGFNPDKATEKAPENIVAGEPLPTQEPKIEVPKADEVGASERIKLAEIASAERLREKELKIESAERLLAKKVITFKEYQELIK